MKKSVFKIEEELIKKSAEILNDDNAALAVLREGFSELLCAYRKLYRQTFRLVNINDKQQHELLQLNDIKDTLLQDLEALSTTDSLTEIPNRRKFDLYIDQEWFRSLRSRDPISLILIDIDFFKSFNDHYGHQAGDDCIKKVAATLQSSLMRSVDMAARYGGEEFVFVLPGAHAQGAANAAEIIRKNIHAMHIPHEFSSVCAYVTVSLGVATGIPSKRQSAEALIKLADDCLYVAKEAGRNQVKHGKLDL